MKSWLTRHLWLILAIGAHLIFVVHECRLLWSKEHYQFFPFAWGAFAWFFYKRRTPEVMQWTVWSGILIGLDIVLVINGIYHSSPLFVYAGLVCLLAAVAKAAADNGAGRSLLYLSLLPLMTVRPPLGRDLKLIQELQMLTSRVSSKILNYLGYIHDQDGANLNFPEKSFFVEEACSGVQSLYTVLFLAAVLICVYRRRWFHGLTLLCFAGGVAAFMNILRICTIAVGWVDWGTDLTEGWQHDALGYVALFVAAICVYAVDLLLEFLLSPVPISTDDGMVNPFVHFWNKCFRVAPFLPIESSGFNPEWKTPLTFVAAGFCLVSLALQTMRSL